MVTKTLAEVKKHNNEKSCWIIIHNQVYDVTRWLDEHPGGNEDLLEVAAKNATPRFENNGHSVDARQMMKDFYIADLDEKDHFPDMTVAPTKLAFTPYRCTDQLSTTTVGLSILGIIVAIGCMVLYL